MLVRTLPGIVAPGGLTFSITVPGQEQWSLRSVFGTVTRGAGGLPDRAYTLTVTDGTNTLAAVGALDAGTEPGTASVTWANMPATALGAGSVGISVAPVPTLVLNPGYVLIGEILNPGAGDAWDSALAWYDFVFTNR